MQWYVKKCWEHTKALEGGFTVDEGGATKFGICWKYDSEYLIPLGYTSEDQVKNLTEEHAIEIFDKKYVQKWKFHLLSQLPETMCRALDMAFHEGKYGWMAVQMTINFLLKKSLVVDGACGPKTIAAISELIEFSRKSADDSIKDAGIAAFVNYYRLDLYRKIYEEEAQAGDPRALRKFNSALRRLL